MKYVYLSAALLGLFGTAFFLGRATAPKPKTEYIEVPVVERVTITKTQIVQAKARVVTRTIVETKDGTKTTNETEKEDTTTTTNTGGVAVEDAPKVPPAGPAAKPGVSIAWQENNRIGVLGGVDIPRRGGVLGGYFEKRIVGPIWGGVFGMSNGVVGVTLSGEW